MVLEDQAVDDRAHDVLLFLIELADGLELEQEAINGSSFGLFEQQRIGGEVQGPASFFNPSRDGCAVPVS